MKYDRIEGIDKDISKLVMGCDNQDDINEASKLWDHWIEVGGNMFDTAFIYGGGNHEKVLGQWLKNNNNRKDVLILGKGAHTPDCNPEAISKQLTISLERMNTDYVDIYIMHRDNTDYPVEEFMDVLNQEKYLLKIAGNTEISLEYKKELFRLTMNAPNFHEYQMFRTIISTALKISPADPFLHLMLAETYVPPLSK